MRVLPSPVRISAIDPPWRTMPPTSCTSKWRIPSVRLLASRTIAKTSGRISSRIALVVLAVGLTEALAEAVDPGAQLLVGLQLELGLERGDPSDPLLELLELLALADA